MPIDLKQSLLSGYHSIAGDYTAFSQREKRFRKGKRASSVRVLRGAYAVRAGDPKPSVAATRPRNPSEHEGGTMMAQEGTADRPLAFCP
jgi:hypothetical protein